ncbi:phosphonate metabolism transcriptional regulator PhnF [Tepidamorphus sp. 3E244]|uniref:phosphonate metabolism transcriptional regulator PhnF n=1 Tax=Tepidamorphus sp. 3E244 TaxID=3385498 RepID=UPI0038FC0A2E
MTLSTAMAGTGIALWRQIADSLRDDIRAGRVASGEKLPADTDLAQRFGVNRHTLRRALAALADEGLIRSQRGRGTFVTETGGRISYPVSSRTRFSEIIAAQNREPLGRMIASATLRADPALARHLNVATGSELLQVKTLYMADGAPVSVTTSWFPGERFPGLLGAYAETGSLSDALARFGAQDYRRLRTSVSAALAGHADAQALGLDPRDPVLVVESINVLASGEPIQFSRARMAADRMELVFES